MFKQTLLLVLCLFWQSQVLPQDDVAQATDGAVRHQLSSIQLRLMKSTGKDPAAAVALAEEALALLETNPDPASELAFRVNLISNLSALSQYEKILDAGETAQALAHQLGDQKSLAKIQVHMSNACIYTGDLERAQSEGLSAVSIAEELRDPKSLAEALNIVGSTHLHLGEYPEALDYYFRSLELFEESTEYESRIKLLNNIAMANLSMGKHAKALEYMERSFLLSKDSEDKSFMVAQLMNMAAIRGEMGEEKKELEAYLHALSISEAEGNKLTTATLLINISDAYLRAGNNQKVLELSKRSLALGEGLAIDQLIAVSHVNLGKAQGNLGDHDSALQHYRLAEEIFVQINARALHSELMELISQAYVGQGDYAAALQAFQTFKQLSDQLTSSESQTRFSEIQTRYETREKEHRIALLSLDNNIQELALEREQMVRNTILLGLLFSIFIAILLYNRYQVKRRAHRALESAHVQLQQVSDDLAQLARSDPLTGLHNRRYFLDQVSRDTALAIRHRSGNAEQLAPQDLGFYLIDIDYFKQINDEQGHIAGDQLLVEIGQRLQNLLRESDTLVRWGGEEFLIMTRETDPVSAGKLADRILLEISAKPFRIEGELLVRTCSVGYCCYPFLAEHPQRFSWDEVIGICDQAMYLCKEWGRNQALGIFPGKAVLGPIESQIVLKDLNAAQDKGLVRFERSH